MAVSVLDTVSVVVSVSELVSVVVSVLVAVVEGWMDMAGIQWGWISTGEQGCSTLGAVVLEQAKEPF